MTARTDIRVVLALVLLGGVLAGCYDPADPDVYPLRLDVETTIGQNAYFADLDGDGRDEVLEIALHAEREGHVGLLLRTLSRQVIEQINVPTSYRWASLGRPHTLDLDGDGRLEVILPVVRGDSLFARVYDAVGQYRRQLFLASGEPRQLDGGELAWDPAIQAFFLEDLTGGGAAELLTSVRTGYARYPRGLLAHDLETGERIGELLVGANLTPIEIGDFDGDGQRELLFDAPASNNGAEAGGFSDDRAYVGVVDLALPLRVRWSRTADRKRYPGFQIRPLGTNAQGLLAAETVGPSRPGPSTLRIVDPATGTVRREVRWPYGVQHVRVGTGPSGDLRVYVTDLNQRMVAMTTAFEVVARRSWEEWVGLGEPMDLNDDGVDELKASISDRTLWLGTDLETLAVVGGRNVEFGRVRREVGQPPLVYGRHTELGGTSIRTVLYRVEANPWWWWYRYGFEAIMGLGGMLLLGLSVLGVRRIRSEHLAEVVHTRALAGDDRGIVVVTPEGMVAETNPAFRQRLGLDGEVGAALLRAVGERSPEFGGFLAALAGGPPHRREGAVALGEDEPPAWVVAEPLAVERRGRPYWLVSVTAPPVLDGGSEADGTWPLLARRVVHDLKNPLTSILLTLQRMQMEAHAQDPSAPAGDLAARLDPYVERVEGRVEHLRRMAQNLLKFLDAAAPDLAEADLCTIVDEAVDALRAVLPSDIRFDLRRCTEPAPVRADAEQIASALENLVMNAIQAMPDGGVVTVQVRVARRLQPEGAPAPLDFAVLEVMDTGRGMDAAARRRAFEPGFTTRDGGTGLGLALVRKVVRDHGGFAEVESEPGIGTAVCLHVPLLRDVPSAPLSSDDPPTPPRDAAAA